MRIKTIAVRRPFSSDFDKKWSSTESEMSQHRHRILSSGSSLSTEKGDSHSGSHHSRERLASYSGERLASADFSRPSYPHARQPGMKADGQMNIQSYTSVPEGLSKVPETTKTRTKVSVSVSSMHYRNGRGRAVGQLASQSVDRLNVGREEQYLGNEVVHGQVASQAVSNVQRGRGVFSENRTQGVDENRMHPALEGKASEGAQPSDYSSGSLTSRGTYSSSLSSVKYSEASSGYGTPKMPMAQTPTQEPITDGSVSSGAETVLTQVSVGRSRDGVVTSERGSGDGRDVEQQQSRVGPARSVNAGVGDVHDVFVASGVGSSDNKTVSRCSESRSSESTVRVSESDRPSLSSCEESGNVPARLKSDEIVVRLRSLTAPSDTVHLHRVDGQSTDERRNLKLSWFRGDEARPGAKLDVPGTGTALLGELESPAALYNETELVEMERAIRAASVSVSRSQVPKSSGRNEVRVLRCHSSGQRGHMPSAHVNRHEKDSLKSHYSHDDLRAAPEHQNGQLKRMQSEQSQLHVRTQSERGTNEGSHKLKRVKSGSTPRRKVSVIRRTATVGDKLIVEPVAPADLQRAKKLLLSDDDNDER